ncbi:MAG: type II toxin-antitoxin system VapC family toxin [Burkholderiales bacterium]|nr:type II toxin-antitoxin system VapC family toxin [Burkholderiales bacterium]
MKPIVIDPSAAAAWVMPDERLAAANDLYAQARTMPDLFHAPLLWLWEMGNVLVMGHRRKRLTAAEVEQGLELLASALIVFDPAPNPHRRSQIARLSLTHDLTFYDASYLELVLRLNGRLASRDRKLLDAAAACGIACLSF